MFPITWSAVGEVADPTRVVVPTTLKILLENIAVLVPTLILFLVASTVKSGDDDVPTWKEPYTDELPCDWKPLTPIVSPPLAVMFPLAVMSLRTAKLPASSEWMRAEVDSRPPRSRMERVFPVLFAT